MNTIVMIPALGCDAALYGAVMAMLDSRVAPQVIVVSETSLAGCVEAILAQAPDHFIILGTSFGGRVALEVALAAPERVKGLVVIGASAGPAADPAIGLRRSKRLRDGELEQVAAEMGAIISHLPGPKGPATRDSLHCHDAEAGRRIHRTAVGCAGPPRRSMAEAWRNKMPGLDAVGKA